MAILQGTVGLGAGEDKCKIRTEKKRQGLLRDPVWCSRESSQGGHQSLGPV